MKKKIFYILVYFMLSFLIGCSSQEDLKILNSKPEDLITSTYNNNSIVAHRGAWKKNNLPQNSIASLKEAIRLKCKGSEFDIILSADDSLVVNHDPDYNKIIVQDSKYSDLMNLKLSNGERLPNLREYILAAKQNNTSTKLYCEFKNYGLSSAKKKIFVEKTLALVKELNAEQLMVYISFDYGLLKQIRNVNYTADLQYLGGNYSPKQLKLDNIASSSSNFTVYEANPEWIEDALKNNLELNVWTVNDINRINFYLNKKFDAITTDEPELALSIYVD